MKKLMTIAAAAFCASAMASESGIVSANIVGYGDKATENTEFIGPSFMKIGADQKYTYGDIKVNCDETGEATDKGWQALADGIILLDEYGTFKRRLVYAPQYIADAFTTDDLTVEKGWYDADDTSEDVYTTCWNNTLLTFGESLQVEATVGAGAKATFAGQVKESPTIIDVENTMSVANCSPVEIKIGDIVVNCDETGEATDKGWQALADGIILLDEYGTFKRRLVYAPQYIADAFTTDDLTVKKGWYDADDTSEDIYTHCWNDELVVAAGGGFQVEATVGAGATVTIKSALAETAK